CLYGGWASVAQGKCPSPARTKKVYQKLFEAAKAAGACKDGGFLCSPALFGENLCLTPQKAADVQSTYSNCRQAFDGVQGFGTKKRDLGQVVDHVSASLDAWDSLGQLM